MAEHRYWVDTADGESVLLQTFYAVESDIVCGPRMPLLRPGETFRYEVIDRTPRLPPVEFSESCHG
jgi:hypothetical protein